MIGPHPNEMPNQAPSAGPADFFVEWSDAQHCFHVIPANSAMRCNFRAWLDGRPMDYRPLAQFLTEDEAYAFIAAAKRLRPVGAEGPQP